MNVGQIIVSESARQNFVNLGQMPNRSINSYSTSYANTAVCRKLFCWMNVGQIIVSELARQNFVYLGQMPNRSINSYSTSYANTAVCRNLFCWMNVGQMIVSRRSGHSFVNPGQMTGWSINCYSTSYANTVVCRQLNMVEWLWAKWSFPDGPGKVPSIQVKWPIDRSIVTVHRMQTQPSVAICFVEWM
jgi:hypothetical protein